MIGIETILVTRDTSLSVKTVMDRIEDHLTKQNIQIFSRINHGEAARQSGLEMPDEEVILFGNPKVGTNLMLEQPAIGIELPLKIAAWRKDNKTIVAYQNLSLLSAAFGIKTSQPIIKSMTNLLESLVDMAVS